MLSVIIARAPLNLNPVPPLAGVFDRQDKVLSEMDDCSDARATFNQCDR
jgi:hypothetical protein